MTIKDCLNRAANESPDDIALRFKQDGQWTTINYGQLRERVWHVSEMLARLGVVEGDRVAIYRENSPEWFEIYHGIVGIGAIAVPVDAKLREQEVAHIFHDCGVSVVFASCRFAEILAGMKERLRDLRAIVMLDIDERNQHLCDKVDHHTYKGLWQEVAERAMAEGRAFGRMSPTASSPASFIYTSGTTGRQKGAVLTHHNFMSNVDSIDRAVHFTKEDNLVLILPLHHSFAFTTTVLLPVYKHCQVTLVENLKTIKANMAETAPTVMLAVPLLLEKMLARVLDGINSKKIAKLMYDYGLAKVVGKKVKDGLGGALRLVVSGGAPISPATLLGWGKLGFCIVEGYGITETAPVLAVNPPGKPRVGTVGRPLPGVSIEIRNPNPEGVGEIVARGENVMQGYWNNPAETAKVLVDGWYHTGDLGYFDEKGYLVISGRKKSLIVNREGKNIYPEEVERQVLKSTYVLECLAMGYREPGEDTGERVGLIVVPNLEVFDAMEEEGGERLTDGQIEELVRSDIRQQLAALSDYKRPRKIEVRFEEFEKTTTQKIKRYLYAIDTAGN
ncbi:Long-chain-fatty-acid--CoA ligase [Pontiella desulfatans]|uniref:Long-chain-fatty-acid--CoA ligase n=1 Tax=Pontiella desulfatans TaxID=2750659 RepID=A0A6C2U5T9_PONDE|nr:AMP-binding protein [Pontiella desulfatans]VGO15442.1 Long-chain-fatty-acid--CoA ligase [Pontiella desulfatans]